MAGELGPIVSFGRVEEAIRDLLRTPKVLGVYLDETGRQNYGENMRVDRPRDIVTATETRGNLQWPAIVVQAEGNGDPIRMGRDRTYAMKYVIGLHCIEAGGHEFACRRTADILATAAAVLCLQRLEGVAVGQGVVSGCMFDGAAMQAAPTGRSGSYAEMVAQLQVTVSGTFTDIRGRLPNLGPDDPGNTSPAPPPADLTVVVDLPVEVEDETA